MAATVTYPFPNVGQELIITANTPASIAKNFQAVIAQIFGYTLQIPIPTDNDSTNPFWTVRCGWQQQGQPAWQITEDVCIITAYTDDHPFTHTADEILNANTAESLNRQMCYTQVWRMHFTNYGPNSFARAAAIVAAMSIDWVHDALAALNIYAVPEWKRPVVLYEEFQGEWWQRADVDLKFNELVLESLILPAAASVGVTLLKEDGLTETVTVGI